jgi:hypothetical protein
MDRVSQARTHNPVLIKWHADLQPAVLQRCEGIMSYLTVLLLERHREALVASQDAFL